MEVRAGSTITWSTDGSTQSTGWKVCSTEYAGACLCKPGYDSTKSCAVCRLGYDTKKDCAICTKLGYDPDAECRGCKPGFDPSAGCTVCIIRDMDPAKECRICKANLYGPECKTVRSTDVAT